LVGVLTVTPAKRDGAQITSRHTFSNGYFGMLHFSQIRLLACVSELLAKLHPLARAGRVRASNVA
jgi:hypothetical protein